MTYDSIFAIASQAMSIETLRVNVVANNIANQFSLLGRDGTGFTPMQVVTEARPFDEFLKHAEAGSIKSANLVPQHLAPNKVWQPGHPAADKQGYVSYPGISTVDEMTSLLRASRAYEADIKIINAAHSLYLQALTIGEER